MPRSFTTYLFRSSLLQEQEHIPRLSTGEDPREGCCDRREIKPLKVMPCLIFRATNEWSISLSQTSSQAAIIPSRGCVLGRGKIVTSSDMRALCVFVCLYLSTLPVCVSPCTPHSFPLFLFVSFSSTSHKSKQKPGAAWFLNHRKDFYNPLGFFSFSGILCTF